MFKISPVQDERTKKSMCAACGIQPRNGAFLYGMIDQGSGELLGVSQFEILRGYGYIYELAEAPNKSDFEAMFILARATMNFIDLCGAHFCRAARSAAPERLLKAVGFREDTADEYAVDMTGMFDGKCSGKPTNLCADARD